MIISGVLTFLSPCEQCPAVCLPAEAVRRVRTSRRLTDPRSLVFIPIESGCHLFNATSGHADHVEAAAFLVIEHVWNGEDLVQI